MEKCNLQHKSILNNVVALSMEIKRDLTDRLIEWKNQSNRKPILLQGARQIGKSWLMEKFGKEHFEYWVKFDFDRNPELKSVFQQKKDPSRLIKELSLYCDSPIIAGKTLIIFDEIQECEEALNSLKYFCEDAPEYHIIAAGSLLGVAVRKKRMSVPVGKITPVKMYPISFREFLRTSDPKTFDYVESLEEIGHLPEIILNKLNMEYKRYNICGGMPAATVALLENQGMSVLESELQGILDLYELDFSKYADPLQVTRIRGLWHSLPAQLSKENRKFIYRIIRSGARSKDYEDALMWLEDAGMIHKVKCISKPGMPLSAYEEDAFKIYACDCGLLRRLAKVPADVILSGNAGYTEFKGAMAENMVLQSLLTQEIDDVMHYWSSGNTAEIEFIIQYGSYIIPVEVKAEGNIAGRSLSEYTKKYNPSVRIRFSSLNLQYNGGLLSSPSPLSCWTSRLLSMIKI